MRCQVSHLAVLTYCASRWLAESFLVSRALPSIALTARFKVLELQTPLKTPETNESPPTNDTHSAVNPFNSSQFFAPEIRRSGIASNDVPPSATKPSTNWSPFGGKTFAQQKSPDRAIPSPFPADSQADASNAPKVVDLNRNLELLRSELEEKNQRFRETVHNLQAESERTLASVQQWDQYYRTKMDELANKAQQADHALQSREQYYQSQVLQLQQESTKKDITAADKVYWLAQQLQKFKFQAHQQELEAELAACNKHLQSKLEKLQADLERQVKLTETERAKHGDLWKQRIALETEVAAIRKDLQDSIESLKARLNEEQESRRRDKQLHQDQLAEQEAHLQERLREMSQGTVTRMAALRSNLKANYTLNDATLVANETLISQQTHLLNLLRQKEKELEQQLVLVTEANEKANVQWKKRMELEKELSNMKHEYDKSVEHWRRKFEDLEIVRSREVSALKSLLAQREADAAAQSRANAQELESKKAEYERDLKAKDEHYGSIIKEMELATEQEKQNLNQTLDSIRSELEHFKSENDLVLAAEKAAFQSKQDEFKELIAVKEEELIKQANLTNIMEKESRLHMRRIRELESELTRMKRENESSTTEWSERIASLQQERVLEESRLKKLISDAEEVAQEKLEDARVRFEEELQVMMKSRDEVESRLRQELQSLNEATRLKEDQMNITMDSLLTDYRDFKLAAQKNYDEAKADAERKQDELKRSVFLVEQQLKEQVTLTETLERDLKTVSMQKRSLEEELASLRSELVVSTREAQRLQDTLTSITNEFQQYKINQEALLAAERRNHESEHGNLLSVIAAKNEELHKLSALCSATEETSKVHWQRRTELEKELAACKYTHDSSVAEWEDRFNTLQRKRVAEQQRMEALLAQTKEQARVAVEAIRRESEERRSELETNVERNRSQLRNELQQLMESSKQKEMDMNTTLAALKAELEEQRIASKQQLSATLNASEAKQKELISLLATKEIQYHEQAKLAAAAENRTRMEAAQRKHLENELTSAKNNFERHVAQWESRYNSLFESRDRALQKAEALIARKEADSRAIVEALSSEVEAAKAAYVEGLQRKDQELAQKLQDIRARSDKKLLELHQELQEVSGSYQKFKAETRELIDELNREGQAARKEFAETLKSKDTEMALRIQEIRALSDKKLRETQQELLTALDKHELYKAKTESALTSQQEVWKKMEQQLRSQIQKKEEELAAASVVRRSTADEVLLARSKKRKGFQRLETFQPDRANLESQLVALQKKYEADKAEWETRYKSLEKEHQSVRATESAVVARAKSESNLNVQIVSDEAKVRERELKSEIQAQAARHSKDMQDLMNASKAREAELKQKLFILESELQGVEAEAHLNLENERAASLAKQVDLVAQIEQSQRHLEKVLELLAKEKAKNR